MICYLNGRFMPVDQAQVPILDRGFIFGDGVYEVIAVYAGRAFGGREHVQRLLRSLDEVRMPSPHTEAEWLGLIDSVVSRNPWKDQSVYIQVTRGVAPRNHAFPAGVPPTVFLMSIELVLPTQAEVDKGLPAVTATDTRWARCDIKTTALLPTVLLRQHSVEHGAVETILLRDGQLTEGSGSNVFVVRNSVIATPPRSHRILPGITRQIVIDLAKADGLTLEERNVSEDQLRTADEVWITTSPKEVLAITTLDGKPVGKGSVGPVFKRVWGLYQQAKKQDRGAASGAERSHVASAAR